MFLYWNSCVYFWWLLWDHILHQIWFTSLINKLQLCSYSSLKYSTQSSKVAGIKMNSCKTAFPLWAYQDGITGFSPSTWRHWRSHIMLISQAVKSHFITKRISLTFSCTNSFQIWHHQLRQMWCTSPRDSTFRLHSHAIAICEVANKSERSVQRLQVFPVSNLAWITVLKVYNDMWGPTLFDRHATS